MRILVSIDDTDNLYSPGTGELAAEIARMIRTMNWGETFFVTRHQLLVHPDIPYTSHNSSMCFAADVDPACLEGLIAEAGEFLRREAAPGSDPGLCVVRQDSLGDGQALLDFGLAAKARVLRKEEAYVLAGASNIHLSEHGGTGLGVIGALAGAGLRFSGNDGRMRGRLTLGQGPLSVQALRAHRDVDVVQTPSGEVVPDTQRVSLGTRVKTVLRGGRSTLLVMADPSCAEAPWRTCSNEELKDY